jgi:peptide/nickel transport system substrate-binding protein
MTEDSFWIQRLMQRATRRRLLQGAVTGGTGLAVALAACGGGRKTPSTGNAPGGATSAAKQPRRGGVLVHVGGDQAAGSYDIAGGQLDPHVSARSSDQGYRLMYQGLLGYDPRSYAVQPELAEKWEQVSPSEVIFHLQPGIRWQNKPPVSGRALTADDAVFSLNRMRSKDPRFVNRSLFDNFETIEAVDKATVRVTAKGPDATILSYLSADPALVLAPEVIQKFDTLSTAESVIGTGAFIMKSLEEHVGAEYARNPDYWKPGRPYLDGIRTKQFNDTQTAYAAYLAGQIDVVSLPGQETKSYVARQGSGYAPEWFGDDGVGFMAQPNTRAKPMDDARITRALRLLIDHDECLAALADTWNGRARYGGVFAIALEAWDFTHDEYAAMLEWKKPKDDAAREALALLSAAGYSRDNPLSFEIAGIDRPSVTPLLQLVQAQWTRLSQGAVKTALKQYDGPGLSRIRASRAFTYHVGSNGGALPEPDAWFNSVYATGASGNYMGFSDAKFDEMALKQRTILDPTQRKAYVKDMVKYLIDNAPSTVLANGYFLNGVTRKAHDYAPEHYMNGRQYESVWMDA